MAFKIASSSSSRRPKKLTKCIAAFGEDDEEAFTAVPQPSAEDAQAPADNKAAAARWIEKGSTFAEQGDSGAALRCWDQALLIEPRDGRVHEMRAQVLNADGKTYEALQAAQQAVSMLPDWPEAHITLARVQLNFGEPKLALHSYQAAARLQPQHPDLETELPTAQMYAKMHAQQQQEQPGSRAHVVEQGASTAQQAGTGAGAGVEEDMLEGPSADADTGAAREGSANDAAAGPHSD